MEKKCNKQPTDSHEDESAASGHDSRPGLRRENGKVVPEQLIGAYFERSPSASKKVSSKPCLAQKYSNSRGEEAPKQGR